MLLLLARALQGILISHSQASIPRLICPSLLAAAWMARTGVKTLIIEQRASRSRVGRADGLEGRTLKILDSFGLASQIWNEANHTIEISIWVSALDPRGDDIC